MISYVNFKSREHFNESMKHKGTDDIKYSAHLVTHGVSYGNQQHARIVKNRFGPTNVTVNNAQLNQNIESCKYHLANP
jgi:hypothetical protein